MPLRALRTESSEISGCRSADAISCSALQNERAAPFCQGKLVLISLQGGLSIFSKPESTQGVIYSTTSTNCLLKAIVKYKRNSDSMWLLP